MWNLGLFSNCFSSQKKWGTKKLRCPNNSDALVFVWTASFKRPLLCLELQKAFWNSMKQLPPTLRSLFFMMVSNSVFNSERKIVFALKISWLKNKFVTEKYGHTHLIEGACYKLKRVLSFVSYIVKHGMVEPSQLKCIHRLIGRYWGRVRAKFSPKMTVSS